MSAIATSFAVSSAAQTQAALGTEMVKMQTQAAQGLVAVLEANAQALRQTVAAPPPGTGTIVDKTA